MEILLPVDGRPHSQRSIDLALKLFDVKHAFVTLVYAIEDAPPDMLLQDRSGLLEERYIEAEKDSALVLLQNLVPIMQKAGAHVQTLLEHSKPIPVIQAIAERMHDPVIILAPGKHSPKEKLLQTSVTRAMVNRSISQTIVAARTANVTDGAPSVVFLADGSDESVAAVSAVAPLLSSDTDISIVASHAGYLTNVAPTGYGHSANDGRYLAAQVSLGGCAEAMRNAGRKYEQLIVDESFDDWLHGAMKERNISLLVLTRTRNDVLYRPIGGAHVESLFLDAPFSTALYCAQA